MIWSQISYDHDPFYCFNTTVTAQYQWGSYAEPGNLGRYYLTKLDFNQLGKITILYIVFGSILALRLLGGLVYIWREARAEQLKERSCRMSEELLAERTNVVFRELDTGNDIIGQSIAASVARNGQGRDLTIAQGTTTV